MTVVTYAGRAEHAGFRPSDPDLVGYVVLDFDAFRWLEEDERSSGAPETLIASSMFAAAATASGEHDRIVLAESSRPQVLFESSFPMARFYLPRYDIRVRSAPGTARTTCAYKGHATHNNATVGEMALPRIAWSYEERLSDSAQVRGLISFYQERLDMYVDNCRSRGREPPGPSRRHLSPHRGPRTPR